MILGQKITFSEHTDELIISFRRTRISRITRIFFFLVLVLGHTDNTETTDICFFPNNNLQAEWVGLMRSLCGVIWELSDS